MNQQIRHDLSKFLLEQLSVLTYKYNNKIKNSAQDLVIINELKNIVRSIIMGVKDINQNLFINIKKYNILDAKAKNTEFIEIANDSYVTNIKTAYKLKVSKALKSSNDTYYNISELALKICINTNIINLLFRKSKDPVLMVPPYVRCISTGCVQYHISPTICDPTIIPNGRSNGILSLI